LHISESLFVECCLLTGNDYIRPFSPSLLGTKIGLSCRDDFAKALSVLRPNQKDPNFRIISQDPEYQYALDYSRRLYELDPMIEEYHFANESQKDSVLESENPLLQLTRSQKDAFLNWSNKETTPLNVSNVGWYVLKFLSFQAEKGSEYFGSCDSSNPARS